MKFLRVHWSTDGPKIPDNVIDKIQALEPPKNKPEVQHIIGIFGYWRQHIPYLQLILQPLYKIIRKSEDFMWQKEQEEALKTCQEYVKEFSKLTFIQPEHTVILDSLYYQGYGNWNITKTDKTITPVGFYSRRFP